MSIARRRRAAAARAIAAAEAVEAARQSVDAFTDTGSDAERAADYVRRIHQPHQPDPSP